MKHYICEDCKTKYVTEICSCKVICPKCGSKNHRLLKVLTKGKLIF